MVFEAFVLTCWMFSLAAPAPPPTRPASRPAIHGVGVGIPCGTGAQARLMAGRAAEVRAVRDLGRKMGIPDGNPIPPFRYLSRRIDADGHVTVVVTSALGPRPVRDP